MCSGRERPFVDTEQEPDTSRAVVRTYVPAYQKDEWERHADTLGMSTSEFVRSMIQAGRRGFTGERPDSTDEGGTREPDAAETVEASVVSVLAANEYCSWDELVAELTDDIEDRLDETLGRLQAENRIQYSGRHDGYTLVEGR